MVYMASHYNSVFTSKLRNGLQLLGKIRWSDSDAQNSCLLTLQRTKNKLIRFLNSSRISDSIPTKTIIANLDYLSVNQTNAQIKLTERWKCFNVYKTGLQLIF